MAEDAQGSTRFSLRRWSQRKLAAAQKEDPTRRDDVPVARNSDSGSVRHGDTRNAAPPADARSTGPTPLNAAPGTVPTPFADPRSVGAATPHTGVPLPSLESLTIDSDYSPFMQPGVDENVKRSALRKLLRHPRFNVMDGLDVYIDDYSLPSPIEPALARTLMQARYIFNPPQTRVNAEGHVEDVPDAPAPADEGAAPVPPIANTADARPPGAQGVGAIAEAPAGTLPPCDSSNDAGSPEPTAARSPTEASSSGDRSTRMDQ
ncbi:MAG: DUF3306 domain-containing protein [Pseudomonadota bacterium]|nr:DUF3306 domain-containing protein [Pseudomonadota bacterium]